MTTPFYAYCHNVQDDNTWRLGLVFANRSTADEWWRAISEATSSIPITKSITRVTPQYYTHDIRVWNMYNFFVDGNIKSISDKFRGRLFITLEYDRSGRGVSVFPPLHIVDHVSGNWYYIRSKTAPHLFWFYDETRNAIYASKEKRTRFKVSIRNPSPQTPKDAIMINSDDVVIHIKESLYVGVDSYLGHIIPTRAYRTFKFGELEGGAIAGIEVAENAEERCSSTFDGASLYFVGPDSSSPGEPWELV
ncbi:hypothetical protein CC1G_10354 [Coprinopsis cinerea okayama7|uniref:Uncharacterized protein n=1 Tax=Coprinopsis cinerea (strain Okayama-7 / 130 / ATCC MYA-4618 / FGSC 9003) TaxID=240176 RepID=A8PE78_COPC7|nr:hypothetical protein CC1G_10354 [Coprinopsis cinerea okayama7\|eukprot:XP_001840740.2 hypothetical protein CC1G_10354 [Coprinopsis cinerea okayama7\